MLKTLYSELFGESVNVPDSLEGYYRMYELSDDDLATILCYVKDGFNQKRLIKTWRKCPADVMDVIIDIIEKLSIDILLEIKAYEIEEVVKRISSLDAIIQKYGETFPDDGDDEDAACSHRPKKLIQIVAFI